MNTAKLTTLPISDIRLDVNNPRIKQFLEIYKDNITAEHIALALSDSGSGDSSTTYRSLREAIKTSKGIIHPIVVNKESDGKYTVIEGNTRVQIYKDFVKAGSEGDWTQIPALVYDGLSDFDKHEIRLQSHLVGPREWDPYSKAKYLWQLSEVEMLPMPTIISMCGGRKTEIEKSIDAYVYMERFYRPYVQSKPYYDYDTRNFSKFAEYQNSKIKNAILQAGYSEAQFAEWVAEDNVDKALKVRLIPQILKNEEAFAVFKKSNLTEAEKVLNASQLADDDLSKYPYEVLCHALTNKLIDFKYSEICNLATKPSYSEKRYSLEALNDSLNLILDAIAGKEDEQ